MTDAALSLWADSPVKSDILDFVSRVTTEGSPDFVPQAERIATFDNDGTLWCEYPFQVQVFFLFARLEELVAADPSLKQKDLYQAFLAHDLKAIAPFGKKGLMEVFAATHAGITEDEFMPIARNWLAKARHPQLDRLFTSLKYAPQVELLDYLRAHGFKTFVVTGGGMDVVRAFAEEHYGVPPEQVIGSSYKSAFEMRGGRAEVVKLGELNSFDDREEKVSNINLHIGRRPILCFGNSDGDLAMLRYCRTGPGQRLALLLHHDDAEREFAYDRDFKLSPLAEALDKAAEYGITLVSMKNDWNRVFD